MCGFGKRSPSLGSCYSHTIKSDLTASGTWSWACCTELACTRKSSEDYLCPNGKAFACTPDQKLPPGCSASDRPDLVPDWMKIACCP